jgi:hypothetical protein
MNPCFRHEQPRMRGRIGLATLVALVLLVGLSTPSAGQECKPQCPPATPVCVFNPSRNESFCMPKDAVPCAGSAKSWYCPAKHNCLGDGSDGGRCS